MSAVRRGPRRARVIASARERLALLEMLVFLSSCVLSACAHAYVCVCVCLPARAVCWLRGSRCIVHRLRTRVGVDSQARILVLALELNQLRALRCSPRRSGPFSHVWGAQWAESEVISRAGFHIVPGEVVRPGPEDDLLRDAVGRGVGPGSSTRLLRLWASDASRTAREAPRTQAYHTRTHAQACRHASHTQAEDGDSPRFEQGDADRLQRRRPRPARGVIAHCVVHVH